MSRVALVGTGAVAVRAARQLVDTDGVERLFIAARDDASARRLARAVDAETVGLEAVTEADVDAIAVAIPGRAAVTVVRRAIDAGIPAATCADDPRAIRALLELGPAAFDRQVSVAAGCGLVPGLSDLLARHAADALEDPDEVQVSRVGVAGPVCRSTLRQAGRADAREWRDGSWHVPDRRGPQLVWLPEPVAARECTAIDGGVELLRDAVPEARDLMVRAEAPERRSPRSGLGRRSGREEFGGARVEVWGWRGGTRTSIVYGVIERPAVAAGTTLAVAAARLGGLLPSVLLCAPRGGVRAVGATFVPERFLAELARRGVKAATFEGAEV